MQDHEIEKQAIDTLVSSITAAISKATSTLSYDRSFPSVVTGADPQKNIYQIRDEGGAVRSVKCAIPDFKPAAGQRVWVRIPGGKITDMHIYGIR